MSIEKIIRWAVIAGVLLLPAAIPAWAATYYVDAATGDNGDTGLTEALAWATLGRAAGAVAAGDVVKIKAGTYNTEHQNGAICELTTPGTLALAIIFEGYNTTPGVGVAPGDGGCDANGVPLVVIDGGVSKTLKCVTCTVESHVSYIFRNIRCTRSADIGFDFTNDSSIQLQNCQADNCIGDGVKSNSGLMVYGGAFNDNGADGVDTQGYCSIWGCTVKGNAGRGIYTHYSTVDFCTIKAGGNTGIGIRYTANLFGHIANCTIDGNGKTRIGIEVVGSGTTARIFSINNCILYQCTNGIGGTGVENSLIYSRNCLFYDCNTTYSGWIPYSMPGVIVKSTGALFVDAAGGDYRLKINSPAIRAGWPEFLDIGAHQARRLPIGGPTQRGEQ